MKEDVARDRASICDNGTFILVDTWSGYFGSSLDPKGKHYVVAADASDETVGAMLLDALSVSRVGTHEDFPDLYVDRDQRRKEYLEWLESAMTRCGYKNKRALFKNMRQCSVERQRKGGAITLIPSVHDSLEGWEPLSDDQGVVIVSSDPGEVGAAARVALSRCVG